LATKWAVLFKKITVEAKQCVENKRQSEFKKTLRVKWDVFGALVAVKTDE